MRAVGSGRCNDLPERSRSGGRQPAEVRVPTKWSAGAVEGPRISTCRRSELGSATTHDVATESKVATNSGTATRIPTPGGATGKCVARTDTSEPCCFPLACASTSSLDLPTPEFELTDSTGHWMSIDRCSGSSEPPLDHTDRLGCRRSVKKPDCRKTNRGLAHRS